MNRERESAGFTLAELTVSIAVLAVLIVVAVPKFSDLTSRTQTERNIGNIHVIREAFMQYYFRQHMKGNPHFPDPPEGELMDSTWANSFMLSNLAETPGSLFSDGKVPLNSNHFPFSYDVTIDTTAGVPIPTMILWDSDEDSPTSGMVFRFSL